MSCKHTQGSRCFHCELMEVCSSSSFDWGVEAASVTKDAPPKGFKYCLKCNETLILENRPQCLNCGKQPEPGFVPVPEKSRCECGAEAAGIGGHSSWCPMFSNY